MITDSYYHPSIEEEREEERRRMQFAGYGCIAALVIFILFVISLFIF